MNLEVKWLVEAKGDKVVIDNLKVLIIFLICFGIIYGIISIYKDKRIYVVRKSEKAFIKSLTSYNSQYDETLYESMRERINQELSLKETQSMISYLNRTDLFLNMGTRIYNRLKLFGKKSLCDLYERELIKYRISKLYELVVQKCDK